MSKYISKPLENKPRTPIAVPPYSVTDATLLPISVYDDVVDPSLHQEIYNYLLDQAWFIPWAAPQSQLRIYKPSNWDDSWSSLAEFEIAPGQPRCLFGSDESSIETAHPLIWNLWQKINARLGNCYELTGVPEGMAWKDRVCPTPADPALDIGWRVYANATIHAKLNHGCYVHRDNIGLADDTSATIIWMANPEWYPSWGGEIMFYPEDPEGSTGDHQQFNEGRQQQRNYQIGWLDQGKVVSLKPNRLLVYDGRSLHASAPTRNYNNNQLHRRVVFRARLKKSL
jgi:hypothetical protein